MEAGASRPMTAPAKFDAVSPGHSASSQPDGCCGQLGDRVPAWRICSHSRRPRRSSSLWLSLRNRRLGCEFPVVLALWYRKLPGKTTDDYPLLACTFVDQKFPGRVPQGAILLRAFFGGQSGDALLNEPDDKLIERARLQLGRVLGPLPQTAETVVRRWPLSLPQYSVGHLDRMAELESMLAAMPALQLVGSAYYGVGLPDLIRQGRAAARSLLAQPHRVAN